MITTHPGEYINQTYIESGVTTKAELSKALDVSQSTVSRLISGKVDVTPNMAIRLSYVLGRSPESWMDMQAVYSLELERNKFSCETLTIIAD